jgi:hypothetical protein
MVHKGGYGYEMKKKNEPVPVIIVATKEEGLIVDSKVGKELYFVVEMKDGTKKDFRFAEVQLKEKVQL